MEKREIQLQKKEEKKSQTGGFMPVELSVTAAQILSPSLRLGRKKKKKKARCFSASKIVGKAQGFEWTNPEILVAL